MFLHRAKIVSRLNTKYFRKKNESGGPAMKVEIHGMNSKRNVDGMESWIQSLIGKKGNEMQCSI